MTDEIEVDLKPDGLPPPANPGQQTRTNNYFDDEIMHGQASQKRTPSKPKSYLDDDEEEEEEEGLVGGVDDAEEFKLGKII